MTRKDLETKSIEKLTSIDEAIELINLLNYDECIYLLNSLHNVPADLLKELREKAKKLIDTLTFDELAKIVDEMDDVELFYYILCRMDMLDHKRFLEFSENY